AADLSDELPRAGVANTGGSWALALAMAEGRFVLGERDEAAAWYPLVVEAQRATGAIAATYNPNQLIERVAGIAAIAAGNYQAAEAHFLRALRQADEMPYQFERFETRWFYAQLLLERPAPGDGDRARKLLAQAADGLTRLRMPRHAERARAVLASATRE